MVAFAIHSILLFFFQCSHEKDGIWLFITLAVLSPDCVDCVYMYGRETEPFEIPGKLFPVQTMVHDSHGSHVIMQREKSNSAGNCLCQFNTQFFFIPVSGGSVKSVFSHDIKVSFRQRCLTNTPSIVYHEPFYHIQEYGQWKNSTPAKSLWLLR